jgi:hypothetical protein
MPINRKFNPEEELLIEKLSESIYNELRKDRKLKHLLFNFIRHKSQVIREARNASKAGV